MKQGLAVRLALLVVLGLVGCSGGSSSSSSTVTNPNPANLNPPNNSTLPQATVGVVYSQSFVVLSGGTGPSYTFSAPSGTPPGLAFTQVDLVTAALSGVPTTSGSGLFLANVTDSANQITALSYTLTINPAGSALLLSPTTLLSGTSGTSYSETITVTGGTAPFTWGLSGTLPTGCTLGTSTASINTISGTPTVNGTFTFTITVVDSSSPTKTGSTTYSITIM